jgi:hypothetical protein
MLVVPPTLAPPAIVIPCDGSGQPARQWALVPADGVASELRWRPASPPVDARQAASEDSAPEAPGSNWETTCQPDLAASAWRARGSEWQVGAGYAWSIDLLQSEGGRRYVPLTVSWGRDLMDDAGPGLLRGRLMWGVEVMPLYWQYRPSDAAGIAVSPLLWRWSFVPRARAAAFVELAFGGLFTGQPVPEGTEAANFLTHGAFGVRWRPARRMSWVTAYRFQHISNGNQLPTNPGVNAHVLWIGLSLTRS